MDGHPELFVIPRESHFFQYARYPITYPLRRTARAAPATTSLWERLEPYLRKEQCCALGSFGDSPGFSGYSFTKLEELLKGFSAQHPREELDAYFGALYRALTNDSCSGTTRIVEKSVEHAEFVPRLRIWYPDSLFVHVVRNPYANLVAVRRFKGRNGYPHMGPIASALGDSYTRLQENVAQLGGYMCVRYEDIVRHTEAIMRRVADFLGIRYVDTLLTPTQLGRAWKGNSTTNVKFRGTDCRPLEYWRNEISPYEVALTNSFASRIIAEYGYEYVASSWRRVFPNKGESLRRYVRNRAVLRRCASS